MGWQPNQAYMGPVGPIPDELMAPAVAICRYKFLTHLPSTTLITKWREAENTEAYALLADVAIGKFVILAPNGSVPNNPADTGGEPYFPPYPVWQGRTIWGGDWGLTASKLRNGEQIFAIECRPDGFTTLIYC